MGRRAGRPAALALELDVTCRASGGKGHAERLAAEAERHLEALALRGAELSLTLVGDAEIRRLNRRWRAKDAPTDVLSFPAGPWVGAGPRLLGDVVISLDTARRQARELGVSLRSELSRYLVHGLLHLLGFDHHRAGDARRMRAAERRLLGDEGMLERAGEGASSPRSRRGSAPGSSAASGRAPTRARRAASRQREPSAMRVTCVP